MENKEIIESFVKKETELYIAKALRYPNYDMYLNTVERIKTTGQKLLRRLIKINNQYGDKTSNLSDLHLSTIRVYVNFFRIRCEAHINLNNNRQKYYEQQLSNLR
ncbi:MAG: hypothetical protein ACOX7D_03295 [Alphaproteobacteria bacterium]|jgi:hypothetical protein